MATLASGSLVMSPMGKSYEEENFKSINETAEYNTNVVAEERINVTEEKNNTTEEKQFLGKYCNGSAVYYILIW